MIKKISFLTLLLFGIQSLTAQCLVSITPGNPPAICSGDSLILVADGWLQNSSWSWSPAIGLNTTTGDTVIASPTATTTYIVTRSCHPSGFSTTDSVTVTVIPISNAGPNISICSGEDGLIGSPPTSGTTYSWSPAFGLNDSTDSNPTINLTNITSSPVDYVYALTTTNTATGCVSSDSVTVTVNPLPTASTGANISVCSGEDGIIGASSVSGNIYSWSPAFGLNDSTDSDPTVNLTNITSSPVDYVYALTTTNTATSCVSSDSVTVTVNPLPTASPGEDISVCSEENGIIGVPPISGNTYSWSPALGLSDSTDSDPTVNIVNTTSSPVDYTYTVTTTNTASGCTSSAPVTVEVLNPNLTTGSDVLLCAGESINLTSAITGVGGNTVNYYWTGPDGYTSTSSSPTITNSTIAMSGLYTVTATIAGCQIQSSLNITIADVAITSGQFIGNQLVYCLNQGETSGDIFFFLSIPSYSDSISSFDIDWDNDGVSDASYNNSNWSLPIIENFPIGTNLFTVQMVLSNGCSMSQEYSAFVGSSPATATLGLQNDDAFGCTPHTTTWLLTIPPLNSVGTNYSFNWGDGITFEYIQGDPIPSDWVLNEEGGYLLTHIFNESSCGSNVIQGGVTYTNTFQPVLITTNPCSQTPQPSGTGLISVGEGPTASFTPSNGNIVPINHCIDLPLQLTNTSLFGQVIPATNGADCFSISPFYWTITPSNPGAWNATGLGNSFGFENEAIWISGSMTPSVTFNTPGVYTVTIRVKNICGDSYYSQDFCVQSTVTPLFTLSNTSGCTPLVVTANSNATDTSVSCSAKTYLWTINYTNDYCGTAQSVTYLNSTSNASSNPIFQFNNAGTYSISLTITNECGSETSSSQTVTVKQPPEVNVLPIGDGCIPYTIAPTATVNNCSDDSMTYSWTSTPAGLNSLLANPAQTTLSSLGLNTISLSVTNECGTTTDNTSFTITPLNTIDPGTDQTVCINTPITPVILTTTGATDVTISGLPQGVIGLWSNNDFTISGTPTESGTFNYTATTTGGCPPAITTGTINVTPLNTIEPGTNQTVCINAPIINITLATTGATDVIFS
ncbi:MAG: hypothetical protein QNK85_03095, partial [Crocinitomicaceae bacterium]